eukprot:TRINITY_DN8818_c0_g1_i1.p1 TRINITY_DN8818_c0_g1~~TRINITY_DN8818_c0_g1_i1.p1  ORF type:complete len:260 (-),score=60.87 TRINITY_DN8818_c0_g1_i1:41-754(-)
MARLEMTSKTLYNLIKEKGFYKKILLGMKGDSNKKLEAKGNASSWKRKVIELVKKRRKIIKEPLRILVLGDRGVGKTLMCNRYTNENFNAGGEPAVEDLYTCTKLINGITVTFNIMDIQTEKFISMRYFYMRSSEGVLLLYSSTSKSSLDKMADMHSSYQDSKDMNKFPCVMIGNKSDLNNEREVTFDEGNDLAKSLSIPFYETSFKENTNFDKALEDLAIQILEERENYKKGCIIF